MTLDQILFHHRRTVFMYAFVAVLTLVIAIFGMEWGWRRVLALVMGVVWLVLTFRELRKSRIESPPALDKPQPK